ncbi:MAG: glycosyltransferase family 4 protein [Acidimicrobiales bacterium]
MPLIELPSLDIWADPHPMRKPRLWEWKDWTDAAEHLSFSTGNFSEPMAFSLRAWRHLRHRRAEFDLIHDNQTLGWGLLKLQSEGWPILETIHHPITVDRKLELEHARTPWEKFGKRRWCVHQDAEPGRAAHAADHDGLGVVEGRHQRRPRCAVGEAARGPGRGRSELFLPVPGVERRPGHLVTTASADVAMKGLKFLLEAVAKLRTERHIELTIIGKRRPDSHASTVMTRLGLDDCVQFVSGVPDERIVELYSEAELAVVPSLYEGFSLRDRGHVVRGPLVATTGGALPEVAGTHGETCF